MKDIKNPNRLDLKLISGFIPAKSSVLDLGCGSGELLQSLIREKNVYGQGVEINEKSIYQCISKGVPVMHADIDEGLLDFPDQSFDYIILSVTIQEVKKPDVLLKEMLRVGRTIIISVPNFGYWKVRFFLLLTGRMPKTKVLPYEWYNTPNIHLTTIKDFKYFCKTNKIQIKKQINILKQRKNSTMANLFSNFYAELAIFTLQSHSG
ncbi:methionine biosynthesis protein MetW [candidate division KSB1 bacterium]|nr:methionine biosynthesis protein MetW [candidate division KSB1 bacterium]